MKNRNWVHPMCSVRPLPGESQVIDYKPKRQERYEWICGKTLDLKDRELHTWFIQSGARLDRMKISYDLCADQEFEDACWEYSGTGFAAMRRDMAERLGLYPAFTDNSTPEYNSDMEDAYQGKLWVACRWGTKRCCRPSHLVVGRFAGRTPGGRLLSADE